jgi:bifunctional enzyme CysN/CysC
MSDIATDQDMELVRIATTGSVDDGKSTLIGRLLYDSKQIFVDQMEAVEEASRQRGSDYVDLALLTDGLRAEREQGITIDVAYRYFATPKRTFILADTPGHIQYTRNMVTGASTADVALILVDVRNGVIEQTRRHSFLASLLEVPHLVVCVNKMDLVDWSQEAYDEVVEQFRQFATRLNIGDLRFVPVSALKGDNVVDASEHMDWYRGPSVLQLLEEIHIGSDRNLVDVRFPVQYVIRPHTMEHQDYRGYAGQVASGVLKVGDDVVVLPSGYETTISHIDTYDGPVAEAAPPMSVTIRLADDLDVSRGDMIARPNNMPHNGQDLDVMVCWMTDDRRLQVRDKLAIKHTSNWGRVMVKDFHYRLDINSLHRDEEADGLDLNEIGRLRLRATRPILFDEYRRNRTTGSFILVDEGTNETVGAGMILGPA